MARIHVPVFLLSQLPPTHLHCYGSGYLLVLVANHTVTVFTNHNCLYIHVQQLNVLLHRWVCNIPELLSVLEVWGQARLCLPQAALQKPLPQARLHIWLRLWLEHSKNSKETSFLFLTHPPPSVLASISFHSKLPYYCLLDVVWPACGVLTRIYRPKGTNSVSWPRPSSWMSVPNTCFMCTTVSMPPKAT